MTGGTARDYSTINYLGLGSGTTQQMSAFDIDFVAYKQGIFEPALVPEPTAMTLCGFGILGLICLRRRR